jgi:membrane-associated protein
MGQVLDGILRLPPLVALALVFLLPASDASAFLGVVLPGGVGVILGGVPANQHKLPLAALVAGVAGAIIGDSIGCAVERRYGKTLLSRIPNRVLKPGHVQRAEDSIRHYGGKSVFLGRFTAAPRALVPALAGMTRLPYRRFLAWNALGGLIWVCAFVVLGYPPGSQYQQIGHYANDIGIGLLVAIASVVHVRHRRTVAHDGSRADSGEMR